MIYFIAFKTPLCYVKGVSIPQNPANDLFRLKHFDTNTFKCRKFSRAQARDVRNITLFHYPSFTDFIKPSLQFSSNFAVFNASEGSLFQIFITSNPLLYARLKNGSYYSFPHRGWVGGQRPFFVRSISLTRFEEL
jgi:hypothetical protein